MSIKDLAIIEFGDPEKNAYEPPAFEDLMEFLDKYQIPSPPTPKYQHTQQLCPKCNGEGRINNEPGTSSTTSRLCPVCSGGMTVISTIHF